MNLVEFLDLLLLALDPQLRRGLHERVSDLNNLLRLWLADVVTLLVRQPAVLHGEVAAIEVLVLGVEGLGGQLVHLLLLADVVEEPLRPLQLGEQ